MSRRVQYSRFGGPEVLSIVEVEPPHPGPGEIRVRVRAAGLNPFDAKVFRGLQTANPQSVVFPSGNGSDFAGVVDELGEGVTSRTLGDEVFGNLTFHAQADFLVIGKDRVGLVPTGLQPQQAGAIDTAGRTALASVASVNLGPDDVVLVSAAAGGVGVLAVQLAKRAGATVIGSASRDNHDFLDSLGVIPVEYGDDLVAAVRAISPSGITAALDNSARGTVEAALALGAPASRINTVADYEAPAKYGVGAVGASGARMPDLVELATLVADGQVVLPIDSSYPLERVSAAYERLLGGHLRGKIVLLT